VLKLTSPTMKGSIVSTKLHVCGIVITATFVQRTQATRTTNDH